MAQQRQMGLFIRETVYSIGVCVCLVKAECQAHVDTLICNAQSQGCDHMMFSPLKLRLCNCVF